MLLLAIAALFALAVAAPSGQARDGAAAEARREVRAAEHASRTAAREVERQQRRLAREAERKAKREAARASREPKRLSHLQRNYADGSRAVVKVDCSQLTVEYSKYQPSPGEPRWIVQQIRVKGLPQAPQERVALPAVLFGFEGTSAKSVVPLALPQGHLLVDIRGRWTSRHHKDHRKGYDIHTPVECGAEPAFTIEKEQTIDGSGLQFTKSPLTATVGQTVDYRVVVTNTGNTPLTFGALEDPHCSSIGGGSEAAIEPFEILVFTCSHTLTSADEGSEYVNVAKITGTPEEGEGEAITEESNTVVVGPVGPEPKGEEPKGEPLPGPEPTPTPKQEILSTSSSSPSGTSSVAGSGTASKSGVLGFASATIPSLRGPHGCVRGRFKVHIRAAGVAKAIFFLDGKRIKRLSYRNAHKGRLTVTIRGGRLKVGVHRIRVKITMKKKTPKGKPVTGKRRFTIVRCRSSVITPRFTG